MSAVRLRPSTQPGVALEAGAASVDLFARRAVLASVPVARVRGYPGAYDNYPELPDAVRWHQAIRFRRAGSTPPADAIERVLKFPNFRLHLAAPWLAAREEDGHVVARAADGEFRCDFAIAGTGYFVDPGARPELVDFASDILLWRDRFHAAAGRGRTNFSAPIPISALLTNIWKRPPARHPI